MKTEFEPGDIVMLKSGGPMMTVECVKDGEASCVYFPGDADDYGSEFIRGCFPSYTLAILGDC